jgi:hypothetical protein
MAGKSNATLPDPTGKDVIGYEFGGVSFHVTGNRKPVINGLGGDAFASEAELLSAYDDTGQGADLFRGYADGSTVKLRPRGRSH